MGCFCSNPADPGSDLELMCFFVGLSDRSSAKVLGNFSPNPRVSRTPVSTFCPNLHLSLSHPLPLLSSPHCAVLKPAVSRSLTERVLLLGKLGQGMVEVRCLWRIVCTLCGEILFSAFPCLWIAFATPPAGKGPNQSATLLLSCLCFVAPQLVCAIRFLLGSAFGECAHRTHRS